MANVNMQYKLFGQDVSASKTLKHVGDVAGQTGGHLKKFGSVAGGVFAGFGAAMIATKVGEFAKDSVNAFQEVGGETIGLQRIMGGTAEDASRLAAAFAMTGTDSATASKSIGILSKNVEAGVVAEAKFAEKAEAASKAHKAFNQQLPQAAARFKDLGVAITDSSGKTRASKDILMDLADKFKAMPAGVDKTALALKLFGRGGAAMLPFLNKGREGIKAFGEESDKLGTTLSGSDLDAVKKNTIAKRQFGEAVKGLQISVGRELFPVMTAFTMFLSGSVLPVIRDVIAFMKEHKEIVTRVAVVMGVLVVAFGAMSKIISVVTGIIRIFTAVQWALYTVMAMNPVILIVIAIAALIAILVAAYFHFDGFRAVVDAVWQFIKNAIAGFVGWLQSSVVPTMKAIWASISAAIQTFVQFFKDRVWPIVKLVVMGIVAYYRFLFTIIKTVVMWIIAQLRAFATFFQAHVMPIIRVVVFVILTFFRQLWAGVKIVWSGIQSAIGVVANWLQSTVAPKIAAAIGVAQAVFNNFKLVVSVVWGAITSATAAAYNTLSGWIGNITGLFSGIAGTISSAFYGVGSSIAGILTSAWNSIAGTWNALIGGRSFNIPGTSIGFSVPSLPTLATGGIATRATLALIGEAGPEAVVPLSRASAYGFNGGGQGNINVYITAGAVGSKEQLARQVVSALRDAQNRGLKLGLAT